MLKAVIFDLWNTLIANGVEKNAMVEVAKRIGIYEKPHWHRYMEKGFMLRRFNTVEDAMENLFRYMNIKDEKLFKEVVGIWKSEGSAVVFPDVWPVLMKLKKKYKLGIVSNTHFFISGEIRELLDFFDSTALSCDMGVIKPDVNMYKKILNELGVFPEEAVMIGDNIEDDIIPALDLGMDAILLKRDPKLHHLTLIETKEYEKTIQSLDELKKFVKF